MTTFVVPFHLDERQEGFEAPVRTDRTIVPALPTGDPWIRMAALYGELIPAVAGDPHPLVIAGDCTTSMATLAALQTSVPDLGVVWIDAHGDFNTEETTASGYLGGLPLAKICGLGDLEILESIGLTPVDPQRVLLVGARDLDPGEDALLTATRVPRSTVANLDVADLPSGPLFLHLDVDVADPADLPGLHFPVDGGPDQRELIDLITTLAGTGRLVGVDVGLTWRPDAEADRIRADYMRPILALLGA